MQRKWSHVVMCSAISQGSRLGAAHRPGMVIIGESKTSFGPPWPSPVGPQVQPRNRQKARLKSCRDRCVRRIDSRSIGSVLDSDMRPPTLLVPGAEPWFELLAQNTTNPLQLRRVKRKRHSGSEMPDAGRRCLHRRLGARDDFKKLMYR